METMKDRAYSKLMVESSKHPKQAGARFSYGTAGFHSVVFRIGLLAVLRSRKLSGQTVGVMITASHNPAADNGVKVVDPQGDMLESSWEAYATQLADAENDDALVKAIKKIVTVNKIDMGIKAAVIFARDTRPSSIPLAKTLAQGVTSLGGNYTDFGLKTTPQLHYLVRCVNSQGTPAAYGEPSEQGYYRKLATGFMRLSKGQGKASTIYVDCANGVGAPKLKEFKKVVGDDIFDVVVVNDDIDDASKLNLNCGADFVKTQQKIPPGSKAPVGSRCASFDGDADRLMYYFSDPDGSFHILDGDKIACLAAMFIIDLIKGAGVDLRVGVVQTAYANGASTNYLTKTLRVPVTCTPTGVKYLHHAAQRFDVGVYFEANGHGTVLFSSSSLETLATHEAQSPAQQSALNSLRAIKEVVNQTVGDALSDLLLVEAILLHKGWSLREWDACYTDLPNKLVRVVVDDRNKFKTTNAERKLVEPVGLQEKIDALVAKYKDCRAFVRPSGTEDCVRLYCEGRERPEIDDLAQLLKKLIEA